MTTLNMHELDRIKDECKRLVNKRATISGIAAAIPLPAVEIGTDLAFMMELIHKINQKFGLTKEQINELDQDTKQLLMSLSISASTELTGRFMKKDVIGLYLKNNGMKRISKLSIKWVPLLGQLATASISYSTLRYLGNSHIEECYELSRRMIE